MGWLLYASQSSIVCDKSAALLAMARYQAIPERAFAFRLTRREAEVLRLLAEGAATGAIARRCGCNESTVRNHVAAAAMKLGARSRAHAVVRALEEGVLVAEARSCDGLA